MADKKTGAHARIVARGQVREQCIAAYSELTREYIARGTLVVDDANIPFVGRGGIAKELAKVMPGDTVEIVGELVAYDTSKMPHRGGVPFLEVNVSEIAEWQKVPKTF